LGATCALDHSLVKNDSTLFENAKIYFESLRADEINRGEMEARRTANLLLPLFAKPFTLACGEKRFVNHMSYSVVQKNLEAPSAEQLKNAFRSTAGLTEIDARALGRDAIGIFARGYELELATALKESLEREGVPVEVVRDGSLPQLAEIIPVDHFEATPQALLLYDSPNSATAIEWAEVFVIAAGKVMVEEFTEVRTPGTKRMSDFQLSLLKKVDGRLDAKDPKFVRRGKHSFIEVTPVDIKTKEERHDRYLLEILLAGGERRYSINAPKAPVVTANPGGEEQTNILTRNFLQQVRELTQKAPHAALNRGAFHAQENLEAAFSYPNRVAFYHELVWLLWLATPRIENEGGDVTGVIDE
jgi:hypothetical protein